MRLVRTAVGKPGSDVCYFILYSMENLDLKQFKLADKSTNPLAALNASGLVESGSVAKHRRKQDVLAGIERLPTLPNIVEDYCWLNPISESILKTLKLEETQLGTLREEAWVIFDEAKELVASIA